ncbi:transcriptional regulator [Halolactibacillus miurensis]|uniref:Transcriptional regulator n=1 Tax=Halolactibacillus miurensis TaxID=306541 RepID=A0A1I6P286_9BACI|nr:XRE family transcriptional regulator [Halolactibacillus miurensis]GEM03167.1 transcriptional regulator [Halolactibacillus miurensis]SFS34314.1 Zn-dependent peptidase ImmA, M78 family [Halolactibacillus miurensis]
MFIGENLSNLRILYGYSRKQLSEQLEITEQAIWQYENNYTTPKLQTINQLKQLFKVKSTYFYQPDILSKYIEKDTIPLMHIAYRSKVINLMAKTQTEAKHVEFLDSLINYLAYQLVLPSKKIIQLRNSVINYLQQTDEKKDTQIAHVAKLARDFLGLRPDTNDDLLFLVEKSGVFVFEKAIGDDIDAYSLWTKTERPYIILGNLKRSSVRRNFDIAHELGHLLLHYKVAFTHLDRKEHKALEKEADLFAGAFLLPEAAFLVDIKTVINPKNPDAYLDLKKKWKTSLQVLGYRAAHLGILDAKEHRNFYAAMHRKGYLKQEPLDDIILIQKPQKTRSIFDLVFKKDLIDLRTMLDKDWLIDVGFLSNLTGITQEFFTSYITSNQDFELKYLK